jgi:hypothetical protein
MSYASPAKWPAAGRGKSQDVWRHGIPRTRGRKDIAAEDIRRSRRTSATARDVDRR